MSNQHTYQRWLRQHPNFNWSDYRRWIESRGYYRCALDVNKPEFYEYTAIYIQVRRTRSITTF